MLYKRFQFHCKSMNKKCHIDEIMEKIFRKKNLKKFKIKLNKNLYKSFKIQFTLF